MSTAVFRIVHLVSGDAWGGLEAMVLDLLCSAAYRARTETAIIVLNEGRFASRARARGLRVVVVPESAMPFRSLVRELRRVIGDLKPDIIHTHRYKEILLGAILSPVSVARHVVTIHGYEPPASVFVRVRTALSNSVCIGAALVRGARFIVVADHLRACFKIPKNRCVTIHNGIQIPEPVRCAPEQGLHDLPKAAVVGWVGRMVPVKGLPTLFEAIAEMTWTPPPTLLLLGDGPERASLEQLALSLGISSRVHFQGFVEDTRPFYGQMDLFALPSHHEGIPIALLEALGAGLPVVAASVGGIPHVIGVSGAGVLIDSRSPSVWAKALTEILQDRTSMKALGERARSHIQANFSVEGMACRYVVLYESLRAS
ncbi:MAG: glycosyltransferase [Nitrospira sp.]|nr:glycosyltransferase [Nitrospira sp.]